jgi:inosine/xanthosine triphosphate pyrophosphatase family protein
MKTSLPATRLAFASGNAGKIREYVALLAGLTLETVPSPRAKM